MTLEEILRLIEENELGRDVFMHLFRDASFVANQLTADDCAEVFEGILKGKDDLTRDRLKKLCAVYDADLDEVVNRMAADKTEDEGKAEPVAETKTEVNAPKSQRFIGRFFRFRKEFGKNVSEVKYFYFKVKEGDGEWVEIDRNMFVDLKAMTDEDKACTTFNQDGIWEVEIYADSRRERMFTTIAKHCYGVEV